MSRRDKSIGREDVLADGLMIGECRAMNDFDSTSRSLDRAIIDALTAANGKTLSATEIAQSVSSDGDWHDLLTPIRREAVALALAGKLVIYRKGKPADPTDFRGVYRLGLPRHD